MKIVFQKRIEVIVIPLRLHPFVDQYLNYRHQLPEENCLRTRNYDAVIRINFATEADQQEMLFQSVRSKITN